MASRRLELFRTPFGATGEGGRFTGRWTPPPPERESLAAAWGRAIAAGLFVVVLTLWQFYQFVALEEGPACERLAWEAQVLSDMNRLWVAAFLSALVLGVSGYSASLLFRRRRLPLRPLSRRHAWRFALSPVMFHFFVAAFFFGMTFRIYGVSQFVTRQFGPAPWLVRHAYPWAAAQGGEYDDLFHAMVFVALLAACWAIGYGVLALRHLGGRRAPAMLVLIAVLATGLLVPEFDLTLRLPLPIPGTITRGVRESPALAALLASSPEPPAEGLRLARIYLDSRQSESPLPDDPLEQARARCEECVLPRTVLVAPEGIPVRIQPGPVSAPAPVAVIEVPRGGHALRLLDPLTAEIRETFSPAELASRCPAGDWIVLRADAALPLTCLRELFASLAACGARRLSLAAVPVDTFALPEEEPLVLFGSAEPSLPPSALRGRPGSRPLMIVRRAFETTFEKDSPPEGPFCERVDRRELCRSWRQPAVPPWGGLGEEVRVSFEAGAWDCPGEEPALPFDGSTPGASESEGKVTLAIWDGMYGSAYQEALAFIDRATHAGARKLYIEIEEKEHADRRSPVGGEGE